jgi:uncharacterized glyoxalase superfamily protein PhnB
MTDSTVNPGEHTSAPDQSPSGQPQPQVWPSLQARDALALIDFYVTTFGFLRTAVYADGDQVAHAQLDWPEGGGIMMGSHKPDGQWRREPGTFGAYVVTDDIEALYARVQASEATILRELAAPSYGGQEFSVADPEGNHWSFGTYRGEPRAHG